MVHSDYALDDNGGAVSVLISPALAQLSINLITGGALIFWPTNNTDGFILQERTNLVAGSWQASSNTVTTSNGLYHIAVSPLVGARFYRLVHP